MRRGNKAGEIESRVCQDQDEKKKTGVTESIQNDLAKRLQISRDELSAIKEQMKGNMLMCCSILYIL